MAGLGISPAVSALFKPVSFVSDAQKYANIQNSIGNPTNVVGGGVATVSRSNVTTQPQQQQQITNTGGGGGGSISRQQELQRIAQEGGLNPSQQTEYQNLVNQANSVDLNSIYDPQFAALDNSQNVANQNYQQSIGDLGTAVAGQKRDIDLELGNQQALFDTAQTRAQNSQRSALDEAIRSYNALQQQGNSRFGRGSSAGQAVGELAQQQYFREQGKTNQSYADLQSDITTKWQAAQATFANEKNKADQWLNLQMSQLQQGLRTELANINSARGQLEADKGKQRVNLIQRAQDVANQLEAQKQQSNNALQTWLLQQKFILQNNLAPTYNNSNVSSQGYTPQSQNLTPATQTQGNNLGMLRWNPATSKFEDPNNLNLSNINYTA